MKIEKNIAEQNKGSVYVRAGLGYTIGNYLLKCISFLTLPLFVRLMTTADYGNFNTYAAYESIFTIVVGLALHTSLKNAKYKYTDKGAFESYISSCVQIGILSTVIILVLANATYSLYANVLDMSRPVYNLLIVESYGVSLITLYNSYISLQYRYRSFILVSFINVLGNISLSLLLMFTVLQADRYLARVIGTAVPVIAIGVVIATYFLKTGKIKFHGNYWKFGLAFSLPLIFHGVSQVILNQFDRVMIKIMTGAENAGVYSFSYNISSLVLVTSTSLQQVWQSWFYERMAVKDIDSIRRRGDQFAFGMMLFVACVILGAREVILILGTSAYINGIYYLIPILIGAYFAFLYNLPAQVEYYYEKTHYIAIGTCIAAGLNVVMNYVGVKMFGSIAAAYTTLIIYGLYFGIHYYISVKVYGNSMFDIKRITLYLVVLCTIGATALLLNEMWLIRWALLLLIGIYLLYWINKIFNFISTLKAHLHRN